MEIMVNRLFENWRKNPTRKDSITIFIEGNGANYNSLTTKTFIKDLMVNGYTGKKLSPMGFLKWIPTTKDVFPIIRLERVDGK